MIDQAASSAMSSVHTSGGARARLRRRYRAEAMFKFWGQAAIVASIGFLVFLLSTIVFKGVPAFTYNFVSLPYETASLAGLDQDALAKADYDTVIRDAIRSQLPFAQNRNDRRVASSLLSSGASVILREQVLADPSKLGTPLAFSVPISDFADLYLKGTVTPEYAEAGNVPARLTIGDGTVELATGTDRFVDILDAIAARLRIDSAELRRQAAGMIRSQDKIIIDTAALEARIAANDPQKTRLVDERDKLVAGLPALARQIADLTSRADVIDTRADLAPSQGEDLTPVDMSMLLYASGGVFKVTSLTPRGAKADILVPVAEDASVAVTDWRIRILETPEANRKFTDKEIVWTDVLASKGLVSSGYNWIFMSRGASREPEMAGIWGAVVGSVLTLVVTLGLAFPLGAAAAVYLEEFAPRNRWTTLIEVNINNLAAVPSIIFGLLGLGIFLNFFELDRSASYVGGIVLGLMTLPVIIIASRVSLRAVPPSIREAALGIGASKLQTVIHHVLPLAMPGIMTGTIIGMARALGETAPLLMIGMVAFVVDIPGGFTSPATVLPVQIYMWADFPEPAFEQRTSAAILVLLVFLVLMNALAVVLRRRFERRW